MACRRIAVSYQLRLWVVAITVALSPCAPVIADTDLEHAQLAALVRQLELLDRLAAQAAASAASGNRYHCDYARLRADLARIRTGIEEYLSPPRAQPRDPDSLSGEYRREETASP